MTVQTLDYSQTRRERLRIGQLFVLLIPLWCAGIVGLHWIFGGGDDPYWWASIIFAALVGAVCLAQGRRGLALYCLGTLLLTLLIAVLLPSLNRAT